VFPAYTPTTASVRSLLDELGEELTGRSDTRSTDGGNDEEEKINSRIRSRIFAWNTRKMVP